MSTFSVDDFAPVVNKPTPGVNPTPSAKGTSSGFSVDDFAPSANTKGIDTEKESPDITETLAKVAPKAKKDGLLERLAKSITASITKPYEEKTDTTKDSFTGPYGNEELSLEQRNDAKLEQIKKNPSTIGQATPKTPYTKDPYLASSKEELRYIQEQRGTGPLSKFNQDASFQLGRLGMIENSTLLRFGGSLAREAGTIASLLIKKNEPIIKTVTGMLGNPLGDKISNWVEKNSSFPSDLGKKVQDKAKELAAKNEQIGGISDENKTYGERTFEGVVGIAPYAGAALATGGSSLLVDGLIGLQMSVAPAQDEYDAAIDRGLPEEDATKIAAATFAGNGILNTAFLGAGVANQQIKSKALGMLTTFILGESQAVGSQMIHNLAVGNPVMEGTDHSAKEALAISGIFALLHGVASPKQEAEIKQKIFGDEEVHIPDYSVEDIANQFNSDVPPPDGGTGGSISVDDFAPETSSVSTSKGGRVTLETNKKDTEFSKVVKSMNEKIDISLDENPDHVYVSRFDTEEPKQKGKGYFKEMIAKLKETADKTGKSIGVTPGDELGSGIDKKRLKQTFLDAGFTENKNDSGSKSQGSLIYEPKETQVPSKPAITNEMRSELGNLGWGKKDVKNMTPDRANEIIKAKEKNTFESPIKIESEHDVFAREIQKKRIAEERAALKKEVEQIPKAEPKPVTKPVAEQKPKEVPPEVKIEPIIEEKPVEVSKGTTVNVENSTGEVQQENVKVEKVTEVDGERYAKIEGSETLVPTKLLKPVSDTGGNLKTSRLAERIADTMGLLTDDAKEGLPMYEQMNKKETIAKSAKYVEENPEKAIEVLNGTREVPDGLAYESIHLALSEKAKMDGNVDLALEVASKASQAATRFGQEISLLSEVDPNNPVSQIEKVIRERQKQNEKRIGGRSTTERKQRIIKEGKQVIEKKTPKVKLAKVKDFINLLEC